MSGDPKISVIKRFRSVSATPSKSIRYRARRDETIADRETMLIQFTFDQPFQCVPFVTITLQCHEETLGVIAAVKSLSAEKCVVIVTNLTDQSAKFAIDLLAK